MNQSELENLTDQEVRAKLEEEYGQVWTTNELTTDFTIESFLAPYCFGKRKSDGKKVSLTFIHRPRFYFDCKETN